MEAVTNGHVLAILVGEVIILPTGRLVPLDGEGGRWTPADAEPEDAPPACLAAAREAAEREARRPAPPPRPAAPAEPTPAPWRASGEGAAFRVRVEEAFARAGMLPDMPYRSWCRTALSDMRRLTAFTDPTAGQIAVLERIETSIDPVHVEAFAVRLDTMATAAGTWEEPNDFALRLGRKLAGRVRYLGYLSARTIEDAAPLFAIFGAHEERRLRAAPTEPAGATAG